MNSTAEEIEWNDCPACEGQGELEHKDWEPCSICNGTGEVDDE